MSWLTVSIGDLFELGNLFHDSQINKKFPKITLVEIWCVTINPGNNIILAPPLNQMMKYYCVIIILMIDAFFSSSLTTYKIAIVLFVMWQLNYEKSSRHIQRWINHTYEYINPFCLSIYIMENMMKHLTYWWAMHMYSPNQINLIIVCLFLLASWLGCGSTLGSCQPYKKGSRSVLVLSTSFTLGP